MIHFNQYSHKKTLYTSTNTDITAKSISIILRVF